ncbi:MAG: branched-chain amino acid ABC transporter permease [Armatimonadota bacterium]|nr:branched-chain amino acid ABC transporter permease [Armatimonadota bacterium]MDR7426774.1 branched-chain amino acid ABC transporter permease [Armatimonadota bacterium]MDR7469864.1 branched-chain amino acid ABC transporter permease [Armatimonadota bacterium]MDR7474324.1 branched-chain amino acid ABC transporter permease [Armatimonadota bacterium]MDR7539934.1 branched-chain amino acid ABC transporter permease [Armatimonadota bacterium]
MDLQVIGSQLLVGLSRAMILFIVSAGLSFVLGVLRVPNVFHGSLYMIGAFAAFTIATGLGSNAAGLWLALLAAPLAGAVVGLVVERALLSRLYEREHLMLILFTWGIMLILNDVVKLIWGADYRSVLAPPILRGAAHILGAAVPRYNLFLLLVGPLVAVGMWAFTHKTRLGRMARAAAVDREMVGVLGIDVSRILAAAFLVGSYLAGLGGALVAPTTSITLGMDHTIIIEAFLIVTIGGLGNLWGALVGALLFGVTQSLGLLIWPQFAIVFPYAATVLVLLVRPTGLLRSVW